MDQRLQSLWQEALTTEDSNRLLEPIMEDLMQRAIQETIPEIIQEAQRDCLEEVAIQQAGAIMAGIAESAVHERVAFSREVHAEIHHTIAAAIDIQERQQMTGSVPPDPNVMEGIQPPEGVQDVQVQGGVTPLPEYVQVQTNQGKVISLPEGEVAEVTGQGEETVKVPLMPTAKQTAPLEQSQQEEPGTTVESQPMEVLTEGKGEDNEFDREHWIQGTVAPELSIEAQ